jgi:outer membrane receptor protein involved in Fe transport
LSYDYQSLPENALFAPLDNGNKIENQVSPKAGFVWEPSSGSAVRAAYSRSLGGANLDQSVRLEPTQLAGFTDAYRTLMPASLVGGIDGERFETGDVSFERRFESRTYVALSGELLRSTANQIVGGYSRGITTGEGYGIEPKEQLAFQEESLDFSAHQLLGDYFSLSARYRLADARLSTSFPQVQSSVVNTRSNMLGLLHLVSLDASFQHPSGFFATAEGQWWGQELREDLSSVPGDEFWQANFEIGYRSPRRRVEFSLGVLNVTGQNYNRIPTFRDGAPSPRDCS